ncbi:hypothetical protein [Pantoea vagans]|uniref:hypothetical protein n=1 Tax=Pantoea vagans TaxID=470934 RepID=UPI00301A640B
MTATGNFSPASARPGDYDAQTCQAIAVMNKLQTRLTEEGAAIRPAVTAVAGMMCAWWESGISGTNDPREADDRARLRALAAALSS